MTGAAKKSRWGLFAFGLWGAFALFIVVLVVYASFQDFSMVEESYYEKTLVYQDRIDSENRALALPEELRIVHDVSAEQVLFDFPVDSSVSPGDITGTIQFYRPSNERYDRQFAVAVDSTGEQRIDTQGLMRGLWRVKVDWYLDGREYFSRSRIVVP